MWSITQLGQLQRLAGERNNLSVYLAGTETDPAEQNAWWRRAHNVVRAERHRLESAAPGDLEAFDAAWSAVETSLPGRSRALGSPGWAAFAIPGRILHSAPLPVAGKTLVHWGPGLRLVPYIRAISRNPDLVLVLADTRRARVFRVSDSRLVELEDLIADRAVSESAGPGMMKVAGTSSGVRGETRRDAGQRAASTATERMLRDLVHSVESRARGAESIVLGGNDRVAAVVRDSLDSGLVGSVRIRPDLHVTMSAAEITAILGDLESEAKSGRDEETVEAWSESDRGRGLSVAGWNETLRALDEGAVDTLLLSTRFIDDQREDAEALVARALGASGTIQELTGEPGGRLDEGGGGVGARLRFAPSLRTV